MYEYLKGSAEALNYTGLYVIITIASLIFIKVVVAYLLKTYFNIKINYDVKVKEITYKIKYESKFEYFQRVGNLKESLNTLGQDYIDNLKEKIIHGSKGQSIQEENQGDGGETAEPEQL